MDPNFPQEPQEIPQTLEPSTLEDVANRITASDVADGVGVILDVAGGVVEVVGGILEAMGNLPDL